MNETSQVLRASEAATFLLREYCDHREHFRMFDDFESAMTAMQTSVDRNLDRTKEPLKVFAQRLFKISRDAFFLIQVCEWKITYIAQALLHAIQTRNHVSLANNTRALIEHVAALVFVLDSLGKLRNSLQGQGSEKKLNQVIEKTESVLQRAYYGTSPKGKEKDKAAPHIESECLAAFEKHVPDIRDVYDFLCEYVHPNHGSNLLVSTGQLGYGRLNPPAEFHQETIDRICRYCSLTMLFLKEQAVSMSANLVHLKDLVDRCFSTGAKITSVFTIKAAFPDGDGLSRETAYFFPKARTPLEAMELTNRFLQEAGIEVIGGRKNAGVSDGFVYDVYPTARGDVWFKVPMVRI
ncbi:MAG TPA: hypothetical protein VEG60_34180 [Candidatus Binatia bacterium]|nr:hypothetical protein [Candidatus Binatia bacterium]